MSLFELTKRNVGRNFRLYTIYLLSMIIGVIIHFTFSSLMYNQDVLNAIENRSGFQTGVIIASAVVFVFIIVFILYANSFFMRQRKKEFGMYLLFGMSERQITLLVFYETMIIGAISLLSGILLGGLLSKLFGMLLMNLMQYDQVISLSFPIEAIGSTIGLFLLLALIISAQSYLMVRRVQLVELFHAKEKMEKPIKPSTQLALLAIVLLGQAFALIASGKGSVFWQEYATASMIAVTVGIIGGTYLFFRQFVGWLLQALRRRSRYYEGNTVLWTSSLRFQAQGNTLNLSFISLFGTVLILLVCFVVINYKVQFDAVGMNLPNDIAHTTLDTATNERIAGLIEESGHDIRDHRTIEAITATPNTSMNTAYENPEYYDPELLLVAEGAYNGVAEQRGDDRQVDLQRNEAVSLSQGSDFAKRYEGAERPEFRVAPRGTADEAALILVEMKDYALLGWSSHPETSMEKKPAVMVIDDALFRSLQEQGAEGTSFELYAIEDAGNAEELSRQVHAIVTATPGAYYSSFADVYSKQIESSSLMLFSGAFLAVIAMFALASVIYFKQLREATEEQQQYTILRKLGVEDRLMKRVIRQKLLFVFFPPLVLGILHSGFIIKYYILDSISDFPNLDEIVWGIMGVYFLVNILFYLSSTNLYYRIATQGR